MRPRAKKVVWIFVAIFAAAVAGRCFILNSGGFSIRFSPIDMRPEVAPLAQPIPWQDVDADLAAALHLARADAEDFVRSQMLLWASDLERRVDEDFLEWHFGYLPQQWIGLKTIGYWTSGKILNSPKNTTARITRDTQHEFEKRVLRPEIAQMRIGARMSGNSAALGSEAAIARFRRKSGAKLGARSGGKFLGLIVTTGVIAWDAWGPHATRENELPVLRENLLEYLDEFRDDVLSDPDAGIFTIVDDLERSIVSS